MSKLHVISDLFLGYNEESTVDEILNPEADLVIINGNIGHVKRGMLYAETLCRKYPNVQFVYNLGEHEKYTMANKSVDELELNIEIRKKVNASWPKNLYWGKEPKHITLRDGSTFDILCTYGFPKIWSTECAWEDTLWHKRYIVDYIDDNGYPFKPEQTSNVSHGVVPVFATKNDINKLHDEETTIVRNWELTSKGPKKILVTHINPYKDKRLINQKVSPYLIHLDNEIWVGSSIQMNGIKFLGANLYANPGRGSDIRNRLIDI